MDKWAGPLNQIWKASGARADGGMGGGKSVLITCAIRAKIGLGSSQHQVNMSGRATLSQTDVGTEHLSDF